MRLAGQTDTRTGLNDPGHVQHWPTHKKGGHAFRALQSSLTSQEYRTPCPDLLYAIYTQYQIQTKTLQNKNLRTMDCFWKANGNLLIKEIRILSSYFLFVLIQSRQFTVLNMQHRLLFQAVFGLYLISRTWFKNWMRFLIMLSGDLYWFCMLDGIQPWPPNQDFNNQ